MAICLARLVNDGERVFHGVASALPMVAILCARKMHAPNLTYLNIPGGVDAVPSRMPAATTGMQLNEGASSNFNLTEIFDLSSRGGLDLAFLGGAQVDARGDINLSFIGDSSHPKVRLPGGAGSAAILPTAKRTVLWRTVHDSRSFPSLCDYVTASGRVDRVVTPLCIFRKINGYLQIESVHAGVTEDRVQNATGFKIRSSEKVSKTSEPSPQELMVLNFVDPDGIRFREFT